MTELETIEGEVVEQVGRALEVAHVAPSPTLFKTEDPNEIVRKATALATTLAGVLKQQKLTAKIGKGEHVLVEGWTLLGTMLGVFPVCTWTRKIGDGTTKDSGWEARVEARTRDGAIVGAAEAECLRSEYLWEKRDDYALRSMAQTRATSKALRQPLGFVVSLAGYNPTPAEEMPRDDDSGNPYGDGPPRSRGGAGKPKLGEIPMPGTWGAVQAYLREYSGDAWRDFNEFAKQAAQYVYPGVETKDMTKEQKRELLEVNAKAAAYLRNKWDAGAFPPPARAEMREAWRFALDVTEDLEGPAWRMSPDETDREVWDERAG